MRYVKDILLYIWQLPQNLLGLFLIWIYGKKKINLADTCLTNLIRQIEYKGKKVYIYEKFPGGISCGNYILLDFYRKEKHSKTEQMRLSDSIRHEYGHCRQSLRWGLAYLLIPGLWSIANNLIDRFMDYTENPYDYYKCWVEAQADRLGGVKRK